MPKIVVHDSYREELLSICFELFSRKGHSGVTMRGIAGELGVSTGTLYHYFPTKKSILDQLFEMVSRHDVTGLESRLSEERPLAERLKIFLEYVEEKELNFEGILLGVIWLSAGCLN